MRWSLAVLAGALLLGGSKTTTSAPRGWQLVWADEFNGSALDRSKWIVETGGRNPNNEAESYTDRPGNLRVEDGHLVLEARKEDYTGADGVARQYTSARLNTKRRFAQSYGRFEARIRMPLGKGLWPAFWLLGDTIDTVGWPTCGEIDILENIGEAHTVYGTLHGPGYSGAHGLQARASLPEDQTVDGQFHTYTVEWTPEAIRFYVDRTLYGVQTPASVPAGAKWVFDHPFFIILDLAVGGSWPGYPDATTAFPQAMLVDYVRVYRRK